MAFNQNTIITGIIMPNNWDETGRIIEVALYTYNEDVYTIEPNMELTELMNFMHQGVEIKGRIREYPDGRKSIFAYKWVPLNNYLMDG